MHQSTFYISLIGLLSSLGCLVICHGESLTNIGIHLHKLRKALQEAAPIEKQTFYTTLSKDPVEQEITNSLNQWVICQSEEISSQLQTLFHENAEARAHLTQLFGGEDKLPNTIEIQNLFKYYAFQRLEAERRLNNKNRSIDTLECLKNMVVLMKTARHLGDFFAFVKNNPTDAWGGQSFDKTILAQLKETDETVNQWVNTLRGLHQKNMEADRNISLAQRALTIGKLAQGPRKDLNQEIQSIIDQFKEQKKIIKTTLEANDETLDGIDATLTDLHDQFTHLVAYLQTVLSETQIDIQVEEAIRKARQTAEISHPLKRRHANQQSAGAS